MRSLMIIVITVLVVNFLAMMGFAGWLLGTDRVDRERLVAAVDLFRPTLAEEAAQDEAAAEAESDAQKVVDHNAYLASVSEGPLTINDRLRANAMANEMATQRVHKLQREIDDLKSHLDRVKGELKEQKLALDDERRKFRANVDREVKLRQDESFLNAVKMYEQLKPRQAKQLFQTMLDEVEAIRGQANAAESPRQRKTLDDQAEAKMTELIDYLATMQKRKSAAILREFKAPEEISQAQQLIDALRRRGDDIDPAENGKETASNRAA